MNQIHVDAACESPSGNEQKVDAHASASCSGTGTKTIQDRAGPPYRLLVVDDDPDICQLCADALISSGYLADSLTTPLIPTHSTKDTTMQHMTP
jgi:hypothetical protein